MYFDSHAHYDDARFDDHRMPLLAAMPARGVGRIVNIGSCLTSSKASVSLAEAFSFMYAAVGTHPHEAQTLSDESLTELEALCAHPKVVAVGEIGLDYYYDHSPRDIQRLWFERQLTMAQRVDLPVIIHSREAAAETMEIIRASDVRQGVIHCYSGNWPMALEYVEMGFYIGIGGVVTFDKSKRVQEVVAQIPLERLLIETDAPYLTPAPHRGQRNDSAYLPLIVEKIAQIRNMPHEAVATATYENAERLYQTGS